MNYPVMQPMTLATPDDFAKADMVEIRVVLTPMRHVYAPVEVPGAGTWTKQEVEQSGPALYSAVTYSRIHGYDARIVWWAKLGVTLLTRNTRRLALTEASSEGSRAAPAATRVARDCSMRDLAVATVGLTACAAVTSSASKGSPCCCHHWLRSDSVP